MTTPQIEQDGSRSRPPFAGSLGFLLMNLPLGIFAFVLFLTLFSVGLTTALIWVGLPITALAVLLSRGAARVERARVYALLDSYIPVPYRALPESSQKERWKARLKDGATWRDLAYFVLLFPLGVIQFSLVVTFWAVSLAFAGLPIYFRYLPEGAYYFPAYDADLRWITVDSTVEALPWAALGVLFIAVSVALTRSMAAGHVRFAAALLGPTRRMEEDGSPFPATPAMTTVAG
ncbi:sensor domain-containing protein [Amycolatopsis sp. 195334CR]|uniref:sensor domain-containing protein n=1 Tax=Amycolatopsis sp. 195334CR TaxID=2814588 RepID=UPI001A8E7A0C|nr:sensor domain-containing protein [Amycolatopsis sp. 195334CR]MBN6034249.1 sensor domain-containing protein [Amycolatopsis sp. 195334CR]